MSVLPDVEGALIGGAWADRVREKLNRLSKPHGSLGVIEDLAVQIGGLQRTCHPQLLSPMVLVFAADHGVALHGVSAYPQCVTGQMVSNFLGGGAAINVLARQHGLGFRVVDAGVVIPPPDHRNLVSCRIAPGTHSFREQPAMTHDEVARAIEAGGDLIRGLQARGSNAFILGEMGIGNTTSAAMLVHALLDVPVDQCVGRGTGLDDEGVRRKSELLLKARARCPDNLSAMEALREFGGLEIAMLVGAIRAAAAGRSVVVIDGFIVGAALLIASLMDVTVKQSCICAHEGGEHGHAMLLQHLGMRPLLKLNLRLGEASGAALAWPLIVSSVNLLNEMASFESAGVTGSQG